METNIETKVVIYPQIARKLLHLGYRIIDVKEKKENPEATLFVFEVTGDFREDFDKLMSQNEERLKNARILFLEKNMSKKCNKAFSERSV